MDDVIVEILVIALLLSANGLFSMSEMAIVSARKIRLQSLADKGNRRARRVLDLADDPNLFLSTVQIGITLIGILSGAFGGATLASKLGTWLSSLPGLESYGEAIGLAVVVVVITFLSLVLGELVPKRVALSSADRISIAVAGPMYTLSRLMSPLVKLVSFSTELVLRLFKVRPSDAPSITEEEIEVLIEQGTRSGVFEETEQDLLQGVLRLDDWRVGVVMTGRPQIDWLDVDEPLAVIHDKIVQSQRSRYLVSQGALDNILGVVHTRDMLAQLMVGESWDLRSLVRAPLFVPESMSTLRLLELFKQHGTYVAVVIDEYGAIQGMVTDTDILESIAGELPAVDQPEESEAVQRDDGSWLLDGMLHIEKFKELLDVEELPDEDAAYQTVGGFVMYRTDSIPVSGQAFECVGLRFEVMDMDGRRVDKGLVTRLPVEPSEFAAA